MEVYAVLLTRKSLRKNELLGLYASLENAQEQVNKLNSTPQIGEAFIRVVDTKTSLFTDLGIGDINFKRSKITVRTYGKEQFKTILRNYCHWNKIEYVESTEGLSICSPVSEVIFSFVGMYGKVRVSRTYTFPVYTGTFAHRDTIHFEEEIRKIKQDLDRDLIRSMVFSDTLIR